MAESVDVVIVGGGTAGITVAAHLLKQARGINLNLSIVDPAETHYYQPALTPSCALSPAHKQDC